MSMKQSLIQYSVCAINYDEKLCFQSRPIQGGANLPLYLNVLLETRVLRAACCVQYSPADSLFRGTRKPMPGHLNLELLNYADVGTRVRIFVNWKENGKHS